MVVVPEASVSGCTRLGKEVNIVTRVEKRKLGSRVYAKSFPRKAQQKKDKEDTTGLQYWENRVGIDMRETITVVFCKDKILKRGDFEINIEPNAQVTVRYCSSGIWFKLIMMVRCVRH
ncbi:hypothetical protein TWF569_010773 [Orbilia oligospora]|uniref:Uncharacterized protein n=1 Tax=Orbilia oligospora TaxID=2813651 RepID=A0A7C8NUY4_ORBOL|nr:hypothetical protein TWF706_003765 [Orbilia oligospora]KAF3106502.1 hypothetical protein TWF102_001450 [Orbilia oligospora]KAF3106589.1 hypothetical protein TWF103_006083 [Orbilia oligospora]KAF3130749.1 hypothetical protein TWF594_010271 [Orbilia oligospora]KAF3132786.1 hypothetical protein TWF569_010773 [Orbilia oligospora]